MTASDQPKAAADKVLAYLSAMERRDLEAAREYVSPHARFTFPGGRELQTIEAIVENSTRRYRHVSKVIVDVDSTSFGPPTIVCVSGTLRGEFRNGETFEGIRFLDRFELADGLIVDQRVWNDVGEYLIAAHTSNGEKT